MEINKKKANENKLRRTAIRGEMGDWVYYLSTMTYSQIAELVKRPDEVYKSKDLSDKIQRALTQNVGRIVTYLKNDKERFFNTIVLAVYGDVPLWYPGEFSLDGDTYFNMGCLEFRKDFNIFPVDGQHRVEAIKKLMEECDKSEYSIEEIPVIFISHIPTTEGRKRIRRVFTSLNRYAKHVDPAEVVMLDEDDIVAIITRRLIEDNRTFKGKIKIGIEEQVYPDDPEFTSLLNLYYCNDSLLKAFLLEKNIKDKPVDYKRFRKTDETNDEFYKYVCSFWRDFINSNQDIKNYFSKQENTNFRSTSGGNLLFRPHALKAYVAAVAYIKIAENNLLSYKRIMKKLSSYSFQLTDKTWNEGILWQNRMITVHKAIVQSIFIYRYKQDLLKEKTEDSLFTRYAEIKKIDREDVKNYILSKENNNV